MSLEGKLTMLAGAIRDKLGVETTFTLDELAETIGGFKLAKDDDGNWKVVCPAVNEERKAYVIFDNDSYGVQVSYDGFEKVDFGVNAFLEDGETIIKSCSWTVKAPPQGGTFTLVTNCYEASNSNCYLAGVVKDKETKTFDCTTLDKMKVGENGLYYKDNPYNWQNKDINVDIPLEPGETCVVTFFGCVKAASKNRAALMATRYKLVAPETTFIDGIVPVTEEVQGKEMDVTLTSSLENDELPFEFKLESGSPYISTGGDLMRIKTSDGGSNNVAYSFTPPCDMSMYIDAAVSSEKNFDFGVVVVDTEKYRWTYGTIKDWQTFITSNGYLVVKGSGEVSSDKTKEIKLKAGTKYYLMMTYAKDGTGSKGFDALRIKNIRIKVIVDKKEKIYHLSKHNYKMTDVFPDTYASLTDDILSNLDYTHCTTYEGMFDCCAGLTNIELDVSNIPVPEGLTNIVRGCTGLKTIAFKGLTAENEGLVTGELIGNTEVEVEALDTDGNNLRERLMDITVTSLKDERLPFEIKETPDSNIPLVDNQKGRLRYWHIYQGYKGSSYLEFTPPMDVSIYVTGSYDYNIGSDLCALILDEKKHDFKDSGIYSVKTQPPNLYVIRHSQNGDNLSNTEIKLQGGKTYYLSAAIDNRVYSSSNYYEFCELWINSIRLVWTEKVNKKGDA